MNKLNNEMRTRIVAALVEGNSIRAIERMTGVSRNTVCKLVLDLGTVCSTFLDKKLVNLTCERVQCDEIWAFIGAKQKNVTPETLERNPHAGDVWTWVAMDADTKLVCAWWVGARDSHTARMFIRDLEGRLANRIQLTTDGNRLYISAVHGAFHQDVDYGMLIKQYGGSVEETGNTIRYSPPECIGCEQKKIIGDPDPKHISTSYIERQNLTMRMQMRRFTRLTNAHSKKIENHIASLAIHYAWYNFVRIHSTLRVTPAMAAQVTDRLWSLEDIVRLLD